MRTQTNNSLESQSPQSASATGYVSTCEHPSLGGLCGKPATFRGATSGDPLCIEHAEMRRHWDTEKVKEIQPPSNGSVPKLTTEQAVIISAYTGFLICEFSQMHEAVEKVLGRPVWTHEFPRIHEIEIQPAFKERFLALAPNYQAQLPRE
jgi:nitrate/TMAO reductase-like tetraheme cytochrome c subunit